MSGLPGSLGSSNGHRRFGALIAAAVALPLVVTACGGDDESSDGKATVTFANWASAEQTTRPGLEKLIERFEEENPDIDIKSESISFTDIGRQLVLRTQSGNPPDVAQISGNDTAAVAETGALAPLDEYADDELLETINPVDVDAGTYDDGLVAFPWTDSPQGFWFNKKILSKAGLDPAKPPSTVDELMNAMATIKKQMPDVIGLGLDTTNRTFGLDSTWPWMRTFGAEPLADGEADADTPEMEEYFAWLQEMASKDYIQPGLKIGDFRPKAAQDQVAFMWDQNLLQGVIQDANGMSDKEFYDTWGVTTLPTGADGNSYAVGLGHQLVMFNQAEDKEAAWKFVEYLAASDHAISDYTIPVAASLPPVEKPTGKIADKLDTPVNNVFFEKVNPTLERPPYGPEYTKASEPIMVGVQEATTGDKDPADIAESVQSQLESALG